MNGTRPSTSRWLERPHRRDPVDALEPEVTVLDVARVAQQAMRHGWRNIDVQGVAAALSAGHRLKPLRERSGPQTPTQASNRWALEALHRATLTTPLPEVVVSLVQQMQATVDAIEATNAWQSTLFEDLRNDDLPHELAANIRRRLRQLVALGADESVLEEGIDSGRQVAAQLGALHRQVAQCDELLAQEQQLIAREVNESQLLDVRAQTGADPHLLQELHRQTLSATAAAEALAEMLARSTSIPDADDRR